MGQEPSPEEMAALQGGIAGGPPPGMEEMGGPPPDMGGPPPMMAARGGLIPSYQNGDLVEGPPGRWSIRNGSISPYGLGYSPRSGSTITNPNWPYPPPEELTQSADDLLEIPAIPEATEITTVDTRPPPQTQEELEEYEDIEAEVEKMQRGQSRRGAFLGPTLGAGTIPGESQEEAVNRIWQGGDRARTTTEVSIEERAVVSGLEEKERLTERLIELNPGMSLDEATRILADVPEKTEDPKLTDALAQVEAARRAAAQRAAATPGGIPGINKYLDIFEREAEEHLGVMQIPTQSELNQERLWREEQYRSEKLLARELGISEERVAELRREMPGEKEIETQRKARLFSRLGAALMGSPRDLGSALERTTAGLEDLDEKLRLERREDLGGIYTERARGVAAERAGRLGIRSLAEQRYGAQTERARAGAADVFGKRGALLGTAMQAQSAYDTNLLRLRETLNLRQLELGQISAGEWAATETFFEDALRKFSPGQPYTDIAGEFADEDKYNQTLKDYEDTISAFGRGLAGNIGGVTPQGLVPTGARFTEPE